jgi:hypothetical protein
MAHFGKLLRGLREECRDPNNPKRKLSQIRLGQLIEIELGTKSYSGVMVSYWESGKSTINGNDRLLLVSLLAILHKHGGLNTSQQANELLEAGNYRALDTKEVQRIFPKELIKARVPIPPTDENTSRSIFLLFLEKIFPESKEKLQTSIAQAQEGPSPAWPRVAVAIMKTFTDELSASNILPALYWAWIWILTRASIGPSLNWPFATHEDALFAVVIYSAGTLIIPAAIGILTNTRDNPFWREHKLANTLNTRLYTHQGASIGFHLGYFFILGISLTGYNFHIVAPPWLEMASMTIPLAIGSIGARVVPHNILLAYKHLKLADGAIFFIFLIIGPAWGFFFFQFYPLLLDPIQGWLVVLTALTLLSGAMAWQKRRTGTALIPWRWWLIFSGLILICQLLALLINIHLP